MNFPFYDDQNNKTEFFFQTILPSFLQTPFVTHETAVMLFCVLCEYISQEELTLYFGFSERYSQRLLFKLKEKKLLSPIPVTTKQGAQISCCRTLYTFTKKGYDEVFTSFNRNPLFQPYKKKKTGSKNTHDYLSGANLFEALFGLCEKDFLWMKERIYGDYKRSKKTLAVDAEIHLRSKTICIEEDLGNEGNSVLLDKLFLYLRYPSPDQPILSPASRYALTISYQEPVTLPFFSQKELNALIEELKECHCPIREIERTKNAPRLFTAIKDGALIDHTDEIKDLHSFRNSENALYRHLYNEDQFKRFVKKRAVLQNKLRESNPYTDILFALLAGSPLYFVPTVLLHRYISFIGEFETMFKKIEKSLSSYFGTIDTLSYQEYKNIEVVEEKTIALRNVFETENNGLISIEYPSIDLGADLRIRRFFEAREKMKTRCHVIVIIDNPKEALTLSEEMGDYYQNRELSFISHQIEKSGHLSDPECAVLKKPGEYNRIFYSTREDLGRSERLFVAYGYRTGMRNNSEVVVSKNSLHPILSFDEALRIIKEEET